LTIKPPISELRFIGPTSVAKLGCAVINALRHTYIDSVVAGSNPATMPKLIIAINMYKYTKIAYNYQASPIDGSGK